MTVSDKETVIPYREVQKHNSPDSAWVVVHGGVYDVTEFERVHPGGDIILLGAGKDATILFETYHPRGVPAAVLRKNKIGVVGADAPPSYYSFSSDFYLKMKAEVVATLKKHGKSRRGGWELWAKSIFLLTGYWASWYAMVLTGSYAAAVALGVFAGYVGICIQHDGNHGAFAESRFLNKISGWTLDMIGASAMTWEIQHVLGHHPYTNMVAPTPGKSSAEEGADQEGDPDVFSSFPMLRLHPSHELKWFHRFQHFYAPMLFSLLTVGKVVLQDFKVILSLRNFQVDSSVRYGSGGGLYRARFWAMKVITIAYMLVLPVYLHGPKGVGLFFLAHMVCGQLLANYFVVNHIIEGVSYLDKNAVVEGGDGKDAPTAFVPPTTVFGVTPMEATLKTKTNKHAKVPLNDWAAMQAQTSVDWSTGSYWACQVSGGLNTQLEHHLFPSLASTNLHLVAPVVKRFCLEYGVPYQEEPSLWVAYWKMISHLRTLGRPLPKEL